VKSSIINFVKYLTIYVKYACEGWTLSQTLNNRMDAFEQW